MQAPPPPRPLSDARSHTRSPTPLELNTGSSTAASPAPPAQWLPPGTLCRALKPHLQHSTAQHKQVSKGWWGNAAVAGLGVAASATVRGVRWLGLE